MNGICVPAPSPTPTCMPNLGGLCSSDSQCCSGYCDTLVTDKCTTRPVSTATPTVTIRPSVTPTATVRPSSTPTVTITPTATVRPSVTPTPTIEVCRSVNQSCYGSNGAVNCCAGLSCNSSGLCVVVSSPTPTIRPSATPTPTIVIVPSVTPTPTAVVIRPSATPTPTVVVSNPTATPTPTSGVVMPTNTPTSMPSACKQCPSNFGCYQYVNGTTTEYKWFVPGYVSQNFVKVTDQTCVDHAVVKPLFKGKENGDANCDGFINGADYSVWRREYLDISKAQPVVRNNWEADFTGSTGKCDGVVDGYDYSLWRRGYYYFMNNSLGQ